MCGIVGVIGNPKTTDILLKGLEKLEYRGYDSAGIYVNDEQGNDFLIKRKGKISELEAAVTPDVQGLMGIGHTRWATHGVPSDQNAHPQVSNDGRFYLVHNGVIENYQALKDDYLNDVDFVSDTDTEVVVQLVAKFAREGLSGHDAFQKALRLLQGSFAFILADRQEADRLYVAKNKSPLLIGAGKGFNVVCSDALAMIDETNQFVEIHDGEMVTLTADQIKIETIAAGTPVERAPYTVEMDPDAASKGTYPYYMLKEIDEEPAVMRRILSNYQTDDQSHEFKIDTEILDAMQQADKLYIVAAGTSYHAGLVGATLFEKLTDTPAEAYLASEFGYHMPLLTKHPFFIFLTQSGETADSRQVLVKINQMHLPTLTITNVPNSTLSREADYTLLLYAGPEIAVASTKAYTAQIAVQAVLAKELGEAKHVQAAQAFDLQQQLSLVAAGQQQLVDEKDHFKELAHDYLADQPSAFYIGRGLDYDVSLEAALKLKEVSYILAEGFAAGELKHGTIALIQDNTPVIAFLTDPTTVGLTRGNIKEVQARGAHTMTIVSQALATADDQIILPDVDDLLTPLLSIIPAQLFAYYASLEKGLDVDKPRNLAKSVTVE
ncbi:glutamine--fructose-6-phosphate transaminase (isomerizing) [Lactobacillus selangorensis]|nr:glutamine--fructose-6-phosphate transaminase (isomerizing) [Lactobacillus selangorensis]